MTRGTITQRPMLALLATLAVQTLAALAQSIPSVVAPVLADELVIGAHHIGTFTGVLYVFAMSSGLLLSGSINRFGAIRLSQVAMLCCAAGLLSASSGQITTIILAAALIGIGYGLANPTAAVILGRHAPVRHRGLLFSLKQTGVPAGIALSGLMTPILLLQWGWQAALQAGALCCLLCVLLLQPGVGLFDTRSVRHTSTRADNLIAPLFDVLGDSRFRVLALVSTAYAMTQVCFLVFLVTYLTLEKQLSLGTAASLLAVAQIASIAGRPLWGWLGDRWGKPGALLALIGVATALACWMLAWLPNPASSFVYFIVLFCGATAVGWNGVFFAELASRAGAEQLGTITGGVLFMTFGGAMCGPLLFAAGISGGLTYTAAFALLGTIPLAAGLWLLTDEYKAAESR